MTRKEAIEILEYEKYTYLDICSQDDTIDEAFDMAIAALGQEPCEDAD